MVGVFFILVYRSVEASLYNKANELQEDISLKRFDLRVAQIHLAAVKAQVSLLAILYNSIQPPRYNAHPFKSSMI